MKIKCELKKIRLQEHMEDNKARFARMLDVEPHTYSKWENEESAPTMKKGLLVAQKLGKKLEEIWHL